MSEEKVDINGWFAVCDNEAKIEAIFPAENLAVWYLEKYGWTNWTLRRVGIENGKLFFLEEQHGGTDDDKHQTESEI